MKAKWYVLHKNPNISATNFGKNWTKDGPFDSENAAQAEVKRCGYSAYNIPYRVESEQIVELKSELGMDEEE